MPLTEQSVVEAAQRWFEQRSFVVKAVDVGRTGVDIKADHHASGEGWSIEAKGGPHSGSDLSNAASSSVAAAFMTAAAWLNDDRQAGRHLGIALPASHWFDKHTERIAKVLATLGISVFRVSDDGTVMATINPSTSLSPRSRLAGGAD